VACRTVPRIGDYSLLERLTRDFTAILVGYNLSREDARRVAAEAVKSVREEFVSRGHVLRISRL
jgi:hypothetical protein